MLVRTGPGANAWVLTGFELKPGSEARSATRPTDTQGLPILSQQALGAGGEIVPQNPPDSNPAFSRAQAMGDTLKAVTVTDLKAKASNSLADYRSLGLQFLGGRQLTEL